MVGPRLLEVVDRDPGNHLDFSGMSFRKDSSQKVPSAQPSLHRRSGVGSGKESTIAGIVSLDEERIHLGPLRVAGQSRGYLADIDFVSRLFFFRRRIEVTWTHPHAANRKWPFLRGWWGWKGERGRRAKD